MEWCEWFQAKVDGTPCVSTPTFCVVCLAKISRLSLIVPCYKRVFVAECHNRYSEVYWQGSLNTRYAVGFGRGKGGRGEEGERKEGERSREGYTNEQRECGCLVILKRLWPALRIARSG